MAAATMPPGAPAPKAPTVLSTTMHLYEHEVKDNVAPDPEHAFTTPFGRGVYNKISFAIKDRSSHRVREKALTMLIDLWHNPINIIESIPYGLPESIALVLTTTSNPRGRFLSTAALLEFVQTRTSRQLFYSSPDLINLVIELIADKDEQIKLNCLAIVNALCFDKAGEAALIEARIISRLSKRAQEEDNPPVTAAILNMLSTVIGDKMGAATLIGLDSSLRWVMSHTRSDESDVRAAAAACIAQLSRDLEGRKVVLQANAIFKLNKLLTDDYEKVRVNASRAVMHLVGDLRGRQDVIELGVIPTLTSRLSCLTALSEHPQARFRLNTEKTIDIIQDIGENDEFLNVYCKRALRVIQWKA